MPLPQYLLASRCSAGFLAVRSARASLDLNHFPVRVELHVTDLAVFSLASYFVCAIAVPGGPFKLYVRQRSSTFLFSGFQNIRRNLL
jgi:hypothetical protein